MRTLLFLTLALCGAPAQAGDGEARGSLERFAIATLAACDTEEAPGEVGRRLAEAGPDVVPHVLSLLGREASQTRREPEPETPRVAALFAAAELLGREPFLAHLASLEAGDDADLVRLGGLAFLESEARPADLDLMISLTANGASSRLSRPLERAVKALLVRDPRAYGRLARATARADDDATVAVACAVRSAGRPEGLAWLAAALDRGPNITAAILSQIEPLAGRALPPFDDDLRRRVRERLESADPMVRRLAARAAVRLADPDAIEPLIELLEDRDAAVRASAHEGLRSITGLGFGTDPARWRSWHAAELRFAEEQAPGLVHALDHPLPSQVMAALNELTAHRLERETTAAAIVRLLERDNPALRRLACLSLARLGARSALPALVDRLSDADETVTHAAWQGLRAITGLSLPAERAAWEDALRSAGVST